MLVADEALEEALSDRNVAAFKRGVGPMVLRHRPVVCGACKDAGLADALGDATASRDMRRFLVAFALILLPCFFLNTFLTSTLIRYLMLFVGIILLTLWIMKPSTYLRLEACTLCWVALLLLIVVSALKSVLAAPGWFVMFGLGIIAMALLTLGDSRRYGRSLLVVITVCALFHALVTIGCWIAPGVYDNFIYPYFFSDVQTLVGKGYQSGFTGHYSTNGMYLALGSIASFYLYRRSKDKRAFAVFLLIIFALLLTSKRAHLIFGVVAICIAYLAMESKHGFTNTMKLLVVVVVLALALWAISFFYPDADILLVFERISDAADDDSFGGRSQFYELCLRMWHESPLLGNGWGSYTRAFNLTALGSYYYANGFTSMNAHNVYLQMLAEEGIVGLAFLCAAMFGCIAKSIGAMLKLNRLADGSGGGDSAESFTSQRAVLAGCIAIQIFFALYCITGNPLYDMQMYVPYLLCCGAALSIARQVPPVAQDGRRRGACGSKVS